MKISRNEVFQPVTITLETKEDVDRLLYILDTVKDVPDGVLSDPHRSVLRGLIHGIRASVGLPT